MSPDGCGMNPHSPMPPSSGGDQNSLMMSPQHMMAAASMHHQQHFTDQGSSRYKSLRTKNLSLVIVNRVVPTMIKIKLRQGFDFANFHTVAHLCTSLLFFNSESPKVTPCSSLHFSVAPPSSSGGGSIIPLHKRLRVSTDGGTSMGLSPTWGGGGNGM